MLTSTVFILTHKYRQQTSTFLRSTHPLQRLWTTLFGFSSEVKVRFSVRIEFEWMNNSPLKRSKKISLDFPGSSAILKVRLLGLVPYVKKGKNSNSVFVIHGEWHLKLWSSYSHWSKRFEVAKHKHFGGYTIDYDKGNIVELVKILTLFGAGRQHSALKEMSSNNDDQRVMTNDDE